MDLLQPSMGGFGGAGGILSALNWPNLDPRLLAMLRAQGQQQGQGMTPIAAAGPSPMRSGAPSGFAPQIAGAPGAGPRPVAPAAAPQQQQQRAPTPAGASFSPFNPPVTAPQLPGFTPQPMSGGADVAHAPDMPKPGFLDRLQAPMNDGGMTPMDAMSLGARLIGAAQPSWNVNQPNGWAQAADAIQDTTQNARQRTFQDEEIGARREERAHQRGQWQSEDQARAATQAAIAAMPDGPEKQWALSHPDDFARIHIAQLAQAGEDVYENDRHFRRSADGRTLDYVDSLPMTDAQRAEMQNRLSIANAQTGRRERLSSSGQLQIINAVQQGNALDHALGRVEELMAGASDPDLRAGGPRFAALRSAYTNLALMLKGPQMYNLGQLSGSDLRMLRDVVGDPTDFEQFVRDGGGQRGLQARLAEMRNQVDYSNGAIRNNYADYANQLPAHLLDPLRPPADEAPAGGPAGAASNGAPDMGAVQALRTHQNDPAAIEAFRAQYGDEWLAVALGHAAPRQGPTQQQQLYGNGMVSH